MLNYTLTTDLIADCMALIPSNLEKLSQKSFEIDWNLKVELTPKNCISYINGLKAVDYIFNHEKGKGYTTGSNRGFLFISHCLRTIPEFKDENPELKKLREPKEGYDKARIPHTLPTIWQATLFGNGTFPQTLEELCESYKNVMEK